MSFDFIGNMTDAMKTSSLDNRSPALAKFHEILHKELVNQQKVPCCLTCVHFVNDMPECGKFRSVPPPKIIVFGCKHWEPDDIPF